MATKVVDVPAYRELEALFLAKLKEIEGLAAATQRGESAAVIALAIIPLRGHWRCIYGNKWTTKQSEAVALLSGLLILEVETVLRTVLRAGAAGERVGGLLSSAQLGCLIAQECRDLRDRLAVMRREWRWDKDRCAWAKHQWMLAELG